MVYIVALVLPCMLRYCRLLQCPFPAGLLEKSAVAEHAWKDHHTIKWEETAVVDMARHPRELLLKEAIHIQMTPAEERLNRDAGLELPGCWVAALRRQEGTTNRAGPTPTDRSRANSDCN